MKPRLLIIRFSSFGDIVQALSVPQAFLKKHPDAEIHWVVRQDFEPLLKFSSNIHKIWAFDKKTGFSGLLSLTKELRSIKWTHIYDAHNNLRSQIISKFLRADFFVRRSKERLKRFLEFKLKSRQFKMPYIGQLSYLKPLQTWGIEAVVPLTPPLKASNHDTEKLLVKFNIKKPYVTLMPSAAWEMKRWPIEHWKKLLNLLKDQKIALVGGPEDKFINDLANSENILNLAGQLNLFETGLILAGSSLVVSADTGVLHLADQLGVPTIALIGPSAFGYPARPTSMVCEVDLYCKPCSKDGRGVCVNAVYQKCMIDITPERVEKLARKMLGSV